jgi:membrane protein insertase Oxa1/YidC/SpoIIIJ
MPNVLEIILYPIVWLMQLLLEFYVYLLSSVGFSILLLSLTFAILLKPLRQKAEDFEKRINTRMKAANEEVQALKGTMKGEELFLATEKIYNRHRYHPIHSIGMGVSFFAMLPVLLSAILLFSGDGILHGESFLFIKDLSMPDHLMGPINVLPLVMAGVTVIDAKNRFKDDKKAQYRFYFIAAVLLALVYNLSSGLVLYWTGSNIMSLIMWKIGRAKR